MTPQQVADSPNRFQRAMRRVARGLFGVDFGIPGVGTWESSRLWKTGQDMMRQPDTVTQPYTQVGPFHRVVSVIARDSASVPWEFFRVDRYGEPTDDPVPNHPILQLWSRPNQWMLGNQLMIGSYISKMVFGEWIWYYPDLQIGKRGTFSALERSTGEILLMNPLAVRREVGKDGQIRYWVQSDSGPKDLDADRLTISRRYNPHDPLRGLPLAASIIADLVGYHAAAKWNERFFNEQNGVPTVVLKPALGAAANRDDRRAFLREWNERAGSKRSVGLLPGGWDIQDLGVAHRDMDFSELRQFGRDEVLANAGVPPLIAGYLTRAVTYNASEQKELYWESTISNFVSEEQAVLNEDFLRKLGVKERVFPKWEVVKALLENLTEKTDIAVRWFDIGLSKRVINERLEMGWDPEMIEDYETGYMTFNRMPLDVIFDPTMTSVYVQPKEKPTEQQAGEKKPPPDEDEPEEPEESNEDEEKGLLDPMLERQKTMRWRLAARRVRDIEQRMNSTVRKHIHEIREEVLSNVGGAKSWLAGRTKADEFDWLTALFDSDASKRRLQALTRPLQMDAIVRGGEGVLFELASSIDFDTTDPTVLAKIAELQHKIVGIDDTIESALRRSLSEGLNLGESPQQLADRVRHVMDASLGRSMTIARTETGFAYGSGRNLGMQQAGVEYHQWLSARDAKVRDTHKPGGGVDGKIVKIGERFQNGLLYPLDSSGPASEVVNCRCVAVPVVTGGENT